MSNTKEVLPGFGGPFEAIEHDDYSLDENNPITTYEVVDADGQQVVFTLAQEQCIALARVLNSHLAVVGALRGLRAIVHDDLTHARQRDHADAIGAADSALAQAQGELQ